MTVIGELVGKLRIDDSDFRPGLNKAKSEFAGLGDDFGKSVSGMGPKISKGAVVAGGVAATAMGAALSVGFQNSITTDAAQKKLTAQLGGMSEASKAAGEVAGSLYSKAYGGSLEEVNNAVRMVMQSGAVMEDATNAELESITGKALSMAQVFNIDVTEAIGTVGKMVKTGMVPDAEAGLDLLTRGFEQLGPAAADLLPTFGEYSIQFQKVGISGTQALGMVNQMMKAGARDTDVAADALKEFAIRAIDGSKTTADGFAAIGLNADDMARKFAQGGDVASAAFNQTVIALQAVNDPLAQSRAAVALFGTQAEDLGASLLAIDPSKAVASLGNVAGAAAKVDETMGEAAQNNLTMMQRKWESFAGSMVNAPGILGQGSAALMAFGPSAISMAGSLAMVASASGISFISMATGAVTASVAMLTTAAIQIGAWISMAAASIANAAIMAASWLIAFAPVVIIIAIIAGIALLIYKYWDDIVAFTKKAWGEVADFVGSMGSKIGTFVKKMIDFVVNLFLNWTIVGIIIKHWDKIVDVIRTGIDKAIEFFVGFPKRALDAILSFGSDMLSAGKRIIQMLIDGIMAMVGKVGDAIHSVVSKIRDALPFSPAKWGPLSGSGSPDMAGAKIGEMLAMGLRLSQPLIDAAMVEVTSRINPQINQQIPPEVLHGISIREGVFDGITAALKGIRLEISGDGSAKLVNTANLSNQRRL